MAGKRGKPTGRPTGRPPAHFPDLLVEKLLDLATKGATDKELAKAAGVGLRTFMTWKSTHVDFKDALKSAKDVADSLVEASLFRRATGYSHPAVKFFLTKDGIQTEKYIEHYPPDTTACIFWLKNRQPDRWRDKRDVDANLSVDKSLHTLLVEALDKAAGD